MSADISRVRFDPQRDFAGVLLQQGRVLLDADWNELVDITDRRIRASIADLDSNGPAAGLAGVAVVPRTTPGGFEVTASGGALTIGRGRMYVDGLLAENHGVGAGVLDPLLSEVQGSADTPYLEQPYWPTPDPLPASGTHLAYLDVWQREVTHIEAPDLVEPALGGVDTTARTQTVWQVRLHPLDSGGVTCATPDDDIDGWAATIAPSGARLTVDTIPVTATQDPCALPPTGGYRGLENQTYRVEVHTGGKPGTATFKWSRDNGSVVSPVVEVLSGGLAVRPASFGRDSVLRFKDGDWAEVTDDHRELDQQPGDLRKVEVHEEDGTLRFTPALSGDLQLSVTEAAARHLRVRRWDQKGQVKSSTGADLDDLDAVGSAGAITVPASSAVAVVLESGVVVKFSSTGAAFRSGDHWEFAARTADTSVEQLVDAPPRGIHHHYARLAVITLPDTEKDCRTLWPPLCDCDDGGGCGDCTICVTPESHASGALTIQDAVTKVQESGGGTVCLEAGAYHLDERGVVVDKAVSLTIRGQGLRSVVIARGAAFQVTSSAFVTLQDFSVIGSGFAPGVELRTTVAATVERLTMLMVANADGVSAPAIALGGLSLLTTVRDNEIIAGVGIAGGDEKRPLLTAELSVAGNVLVCRTLGLALEGRVGHLLGNTVTDNSVLRATDAGIRLRGTVAPGHAFAVSDNTVLVGGNGIEVATAGFTVDGNDVTGTTDSLKRRGDGIAVVPGTFGSVRGPTRLASNRVRDVGGRGIAVLAPTTSLQVTHNLVERALDGIVMDERARAESVVVSDNTVTDVGSRESDKSAGVVGIQVVGSGRATVESNVVHGVGSAREVGDGSAGIRVVACVESRVADNSVDRVGFPEAAGQDLGIAVHGGIRRTQVAGNQARRQPVDVDEDGPSAFRGLLVGGSGDPRELSVTPTKSYVVADGAAGFAVGSFAAHAVAVKQTAVTVDTNHLSGSGEISTALVRVLGEAVITGNQIDSREGGAAALEVAATAATISANRLRGGRPSGSFDVDPKRLAVLGNLTSTGIQVFGGALEPHWAPLNLDGI